MPVIRGQSKLKSLEIGEGNALSAELASEFGGAGITAHPTPYIFEIPRDFSKEFGVIVVWNKFEGLATEDRTKIIRDAYRKRAKKSKVPAPYDVQGLTVRETLESGALPYSITPTAHYPEDDGEYRTEWNNRMLDAGAIPGLDGRPELRFPTRDMAEQVLGEMISKMPDAHWRLREWE